MMAKSENQTSIYPQRSTAHLNRRANPLILLKSENVHQMPIVSRDAMVGAGSSTRQRQFVDTTSVRTRMTATREIPVDVKLRVFQTSSPGTFASQETAGRILIAGLEAIAARLWGSVGLQMV